MAEPLSEISNVGVNQQYVPDRTNLPKLDYTTRVSSTISEVSAAHWDDGTWDEESLRVAASENVVATWGPSKGVPDLPILTHGEGVYLYDRDGKEYLDWTSQAVCANLGHTVPKSIQSAVSKQMKDLPMVYGGLGLVEVRARLAHLMSQICPGDLNGFVFPSGGGEANEAAIRMARRFTGRHKILNQYRSYHGGSTFKFADNEKEKTELLLNMLDEQIRMEGPQTVAAIMLEPIVGAGGALIPPKGYIEGVRALCDKYDILLIADEVMVGFGRTGKFWGFQHFEGVIPDILTSAKGLSASVLPLAVVGMRQKIKNFFNENPLGWGATYANHPVALACAYESVKHVIKERIPERAAKMESVMVDEMKSIVERHSCVRQARAIGLFGCLDLVGPDGNMVQQYQDANPERVVALRKAMLDEGLMGLFRPPLLHCAPPLVIQEDELRDGFQRLDRALCVADW